MESFRHNSGSGFEVPRQFEAHFHGSLQCIFMGSFGYKSGSRFDDSFMDPHGSSQWIFMTARSFGYNSGSELDGSFMDLHGSFRRFFMAV